MPHALTRIEVIASCPAQRYQRACIDQRCQARHGRKLRMCVITSEPFAMACVIPPHHPVSQIRTRLAAQHAGER